MQAHQRQGTFPPPPTPRAISRPEKRTTDGASQSRAPRKKDTRRDGERRRRQPPSPSSRIEPELTLSVSPAQPLDRARRCPTSTAPSSSRTRPRWARLRRSSDPSTRPCSPSRWRRASSRARTVRAISSTSPPISSSPWSVSSRRRAAAAAAAEDAEEDAAVAAAVAAAAEAAAVPAVAEAVAEAVVSAEAAVAAAVVSAAVADEDAVERVDVVRRSIARGGMKRRTRRGRVPPDARRTPNIKARRLRRRRVDGREATASTRWFRKLCNDQHMSFHAATMRDGEDARISVLESDRDIAFRFVSMSDGCGAEARAIGSDLTSTRSLAQHWATATQGFGRPPAGHFSDVQAPGSRASRGGRECMNRGAGKENEVLLDLCRSNPTGKKTGRSDTTGRGDETRAPRHRAGLYERAVATRRRAGIRVFRLAGKLDPSDDTGHHRCVSDRQNPDAKIRHRSRCIFFPGSVARGSRRRPPRRRPRGR